MANLWMLKAWDRFPPRSEFGFVVHTPPFRPLFALLAVIGCLAVAIWFLRRRLMAIRAPAAVWAGQVLTTMLVAAPLLAEGNQHPRRVTLVALVVLAVVVWKLQLALRCAYVLVLVLLPLLPIQTGTAMWTLIRATASHEIAAHDLRPFPVGRQRIVWMIFDELDQSLLFRHRAPLLKVPEFDRLRSQSFHAEDAEAPGGSTYRCMPALLSGRTVVSTQPLAGGDLELRFHSGETGRWTGQPHLFLTARQLGLNTAIIGWYLPYCTVFGTHLNYCYAAPDDDATDTIRSLEYDRTLPLPHVAFHYLRAEFSGLRGGEGDADSGEMAYVHKQHREASASVFARALTVLSDPRYGFVLVHLPIPHPPGVGTGANAGYLDNLEQADRCLGQMRRVMEQAGTWDQAAVLVSGDHGYRRRLWKQQPDWTQREAADTAAASPSTVPFLLKLAGAHAETSFAHRFNTVVTSDLFRAMLAGRVRSESDVAEFLSTR